MRIHLNIGSNMGDRMALMGRAVALLARRLPVCKLYLSDYVESEPWGYSSPRPYLNRGILAVTDAEAAPLDILAIVQSVEKAVGHGHPHRNKDGSYCDRPIDIDIIDIDGLELRHPLLTLPHPRAMLRRFVTVPMEQLNRLYPPDC